MKSAFRMNYASYMDSFQAQKLSSYLDNFIRSGIDQVYVHCYYGESRSGAIALYLQNNHGFTANKPITKSNRTVYELLCDPLKYEALIQSYETQPIDKETPIHLKLWNLLLVAIGFRP